MPGYLAVSDEQTLTPAGRIVVGKDFLPRSEAAAQSAPPPAAAGARSGVWISPVYNPGAPALARIRGGIMAGRWAAADYEILCLGDSKTAGTGAAAGQRPPQSWPGVLARALGAVEGFISASLTAEDERWTASNMGRGGGDMNGLVTTTAGTASAVSLSYSEPHAGGFFLLQSSTATTVSVRVDGGAAQTLTLPAGPGFQRITPAVQGDSAHRYEISGSGVLRLLGFRPAYSAPRLKITNAARPGSTAAGWVPGYLPNIGLWDSYRVAVPAPDAILCQLGTNAPADVAPFAPLWTAIKALTEQALIITPGGIGGASPVDPPSVFGPMYSAAWDQADRLGLPLVDFGSVIGNHDAAQSLGLKADALHENRTGYAYEAAALQHLLT